jgi:hypothetical protein
MSVLLVVGILAGPVGTLVCRLQCVSAAVDEERAAGACGDHGASPAVRLRAGAPPCDEVVGVPAVKQERFDSTCLAAVELPSTLPRFPSEGDRRRESRPTRPVVELAFTGTDLPLRI